MRLFGWFRPVVSTEPTIAPLNAKQYRFTGHDEQLAVRSRARRELAEEIRRNARWIETCDDSRSKLRSVK